MFYVPPCCSTRLRKINKRMSENLSSEVDYVNVSQINAVMPPSLNFLFILTYFNTFLISMLFTWLNKNKKIIILKNQ